MNEEQLRAQLQAVYASKSWKITAPMRELVALFNRLSALLRHPYRIPGIVLRRASANATLRHYGRLLLRAFPGWRAGILRRMNPPELDLVQMPATTARAASLTTQDAESALPNIISPAEDHLSPAARKVLFQLRAAKIRRS